MAYLHDNQYLGYGKKRSSNKVINLLLLFLVLIIIFFLNKYFKKFSYNITIPVVNTGSNLSRGLYSLAHSKSDLLNRIESLESENSELQNKLVDYSLIENENNGFKGSVISNIGGVVATIIARPSKVPYDTLLINTSEPINSNAVVYSVSGIPLGHVDSEKINILTNKDNKIYSSTVKLFSNPGNEFDADIILNDAMDSTTVKLKGRGGASYEAIIPADINVPVGSFAVIPSLSSKPIAEVVKISSRNDTKDKIIYLRSTVNFQYLRYILISK